MPVYFLDLITLVCFFKFRPGSLKINKFNKLLAFYVLVSFFSFLVELLVYNDYISIYFFMRWILSYLTFIVVIELLDNIHSIKIVLKTIIIAATINSLISLGYSFSSTRSYVKPLFSNDNIFPQRVRVQDRLEDKESQRGITLASPATTTPLLIIPGICILLFIYGKSKFIKISSSLAIILITLMVSASLITLSRSVILTFALYFLFLFFRSSFKLKRIIFVSVILLLVSINYSNILKNIDYSRIEESLNMLESNKIGYSETERIYAYIKPFEHLIEYPSSILFGHGLSVEKHKRKYILYNKKIKGKHGFPGAIIYDRGLLAFMIMFVFLVVFYRKVYKKETDEYFHFLNLLLLINFILPIITEHYLFDNIVGSYQLFYLFAVMLSLKKIRINNENNHLYYFKK